MRDIEIKKYNKSFVSVRNLNKDLEISDAQWDRLFEANLKLFDNVYFNGRRIWTMGLDFDDILSYLSDATFFDKRKNESEILFRVKNSSIMYNRRLVSNMWDYYEYPSFIFLEDKSQEEALIKAYKKRTFIDDIIEKTDGLLIMYRSFEQDVIWIKGNVDVCRILETAFE
jgi:hypothetical protein